MKSYKNEARERYGNTAAYREHEQKTKMRTQTFVNCSAAIAVRTMYPITLCIAVLNCCFDPIIYYFTSDTIQNSIKMKNWSTRRSDSRFSEVQGTENFIQHNLQTLKNKIPDNESTI